MSKLERRYENDTLRPSDIERWTSGNSPKDVYQIVKEFWKVEIEPPKIRAVSYPTGDLCGLKEGIVPIEVKDVKFFKKFFERAGRKTAADYMLKSIAGGRFSMYFLFCQRPENFNCGFSFCEPDYSLEGFQNYVSIASQTRAIDEIGARIVERNLGIYDPLMLPSAIKAHFEELEERAKFSPKKIEKALNEIRRPELRKVRITERQIERVEENKKVKMDKLLENAMIGTTMRFTANDLENEYGGRFHQLINRVFEPEKKYLEYFKNFVKTHMLTFKMHLSAEFPSLYEDTQKKKSLNV
jgi:hypothetical protein